MLSPMLSLDLFKPFGKIYRPTMSFDTTYDLTWHAFQDSALFVPSEALGLSEKVVASIAQGVDIREVGQMGVDFGAYVKDLKPVTLTSQALTDAALKVASLEYYKKQSGWLEKVHKDQGKPYAAAAIMEKKAAESVEKILTTELGIGAEVMGKLPSKGKQFAPIYEANFVSHQQGQSVLSFTHYATSEARLLLSGHELLIGWKFEQLQGSNFGQKLTWLNSLTVEKALELASRIGFVKHHATLGQLVVVPAGFMLASITVGDAAFLRWCLSVPAGSADAQKRECAQIFANLGSLVEAFPSLKCGLHGSWKSHVELHM